MSKPNGVKEEKPKKIKFDMRWDPGALEDVREMASLTDKSVAEVIETAACLYIAKEKPRLAKLAKLKAQLLPS